MLRLIAEWGVPVLGNCFKIEICAPPILLELCYEALSMSIDEFDKAYNLSIEVLTKSPSHLSNPRINSLTSVRIHRYFSIALDRHLDAKNDDNNGELFTSVYQLHLSRGYYKDLELAKNTDE